ncbi:MAG: glycosyltransferase [Nitrospirae bacterium]|nr:glycosyltransferase [Nitrospirota bacterium]
MPLISVIVRCFNYGHFIAETLESLFVQTHDNWECIVVDDGSTDNTREVVESFIRHSSRVKYFYQVNKGLSAAMNLGLSHAAGEFIQFLDADDMISPSKLELHLKHFAEKPNIDVSYSSGKYFKGTNKEVFYSTRFLKNKEWIPRLSASGYAFLKHCISKNIMPVNSPLFRGRAINQLCGFDECLQAAEDWDFLLRAALQGLYFEYLDDDSALALIRVHKTSVSQSSNKLTTGNVSLRLKLPSLISICPILSTEEKRLLLKLNHTRTIHACARLIVKNGALNSATFQSLRRFGFIVLCLSYIRGLRKILSHPIRSFRAAGMMRG